MINIWINTFHSIHHLINYWLSYFANRIFPIMNSFIKLFNFIKFKIILNIIEK